MCTVTFLKHDDTIIITSNRDEKRTRAEAKPPIRKTINGIELCFPQDPVAGGTWFALNNKLEVMVLLNGASKSHVSQQPYKKSRGLIVLDLIESDDVLNHWHNIDLNRIEPFTLVYFKPQQLWQLQWDSFNKNLQSLPITEPHLWASSTLYAPEVINKRKQAFTKHNQQQQAITPQTVLAFHTQTFADDKINGLIIERELVNTHSITQAVIQGKQATLSYSSLKDKLQVEPETMEHVH